MRRYDHIISLPHHISSSHARMTNYHRAAQFSSFKALTGFEDEIEESARHVEERLELTEMQQDALDQAMQRLLEEERPQVTVTYFVPDPLKNGGTYATYTGIFRFWEMDTGKLKFGDGTKIPVRDVYGISFANDLHEALSD